MALRNMHLEDFFKGPPEIGIRKGSQCAYATNMKSRISSSTPKFRVRNQSHGLISGHEWDPRPIRLPTGRRGAAVSGGGGGRMGARRIKIAAYARWLMGKRHVHDIGILGYWDIGILGYWDIGRAIESALTVRVEKRVEVF
jgi:hypothetical protein